MQNRCQSHGRASYGRAEHPLDAKEQLITTRTSASPSVPLPKASPLGVPLRLVEGYFLVLLLLLLGYALAIPPKEFVYDFTMLRMLVVAGVASLSLWLLERRARAAQTLVPWGLLVSLAVTTLDVFISPGASAKGPEIPAPAYGFFTALYGVLTLGAIVSVATSSHARAVLVQPLSQTPAQEERLTTDLPCPRAFTWPWVRNLVLYYCAASLIGHWGEIAFCWLIVLGVFDGSYDFSHAQLWSWWLYPYPAEGIAMVLCVVALYPLKQWLLKRFCGRILPTLLVSFLAITAVCCAVDFLTGITVNADYHLWDYRDLPYNFLGQVVLQNTLVYGIAATIVVWVIYPFLARCLARLRPAVVDGLFFMSVGVYAFLEVLYFIQLTPTGLVFG